MTRNGATAPELSGGRETPLPAQAAREFAQRTRGAGAGIGPLNALTVFYADALAVEGFKVNAHAPGLRRTDLNERAGGAGADPAEGAAGAVRLALLPDDGPTGGYFDWDGTVLSW